MLNAGTANDERQRPSFPFLADLGERHGRMQAVGRLLGAETKRMVEPEPAGGAPTGPGGIEYPRHAGRDARPGLDSERFSGPRNLSQTWLLSGIPRSGTSLCCRLAGGLPDTVALSEPIRRKAWGGMDTPRGATVRIRDFAEQTRERILAEGRAPSIQVGGELDDNRVALQRGDSGLRQPRGEWGEIATGKPLTSRFTLVIKHNALFAALLPHLTDFFPCLALVRNPLSVLASWQTVNLPVQRGRIPAGEELDPGLCRALDREPNVLERQLIVLDWFFGRFRDGLALENILRYEDLVESGGLALYRRLGHSRARPTVLGSRNDSTLYDRASVDTLLDALLKTGGNWRHFYRPSDCEEVATGIRTGR